MEALMQNTSSNISSINNFNSIVQPVMHLLSSAVLLSSVAVQVILGRPSGNQDFSARTESIDSFIESESPLAYEQLLCNIGPDGCHASGVSSGIVIASPDKQDPDCKSRI